MHSLVLIHKRGYPIEQLALQSSHLETAYLLIYGSLPTKAQFDVFHHEVMHHGVMHADAEQFFRSFRFVPTTCSVACVCSFRV